jgi:acetyl esterase
MNDGLDPEIRAFVAAMSATWREHPALDSVSLAEARRIADKVRGRFAVGGPAMMRTTHHPVPHGSRSVRIRVYDPSPSSPKPALVYLHGGGWIMFSLDTHDRIMREYAARADIVVIGVDYSLAPEARFPHAIDEVTSVIRWLKRYANDIGIDGSRIALGGDSAGAALSLSTCLRLRELHELSSIRAMLLNYGCFDPACTNASFERYGREEYLWSAGEMQGYWREYLGGTSPRDPLAAPIHADLQDLPPALLVIPECDVLRDDSFMMAERLSAAGVATQTLHYPGATHSFLEAVSMAEISKRAFDDMAHWLRGILTD